MDHEPAREALLEILVEAALAGHDLTPFDPVPSGGYQSRCRRCHKTAWLGPTGLIYSLLPDPCIPLLNYFPSLLTLRARNSALDTC
jgi:hypothetical protein